MNDTRILGVFSRCALVHHHPTNQFLSAPYPRCRMSSRLVNVTDFPLVTCILRRYGWYELGLRNMYQLLALLKYGSLTGLARKCLVAANSSDIATKKIHLIGYSYTCRVCVFCKSLFLDVYLVWPFSESRLTFHPRARLWLRLYTRVHIHFHSTQPRLTQAHWWCHPRNDKVPIRRESVC